MKKEKNSLVQKGLLLSLFLISLLAVFKFSSGTYFQASIVNVINSNTAQTNSEKIYFVDAENGDDSKDGQSASSAWKTLSYSLGNLNPGDTLEIMAGNYFPTSKLRIARSGEEGKYITIKNHAEDRVIINGEAIEDSGGLITIDQKSYIKVQGLDFTAFSGNWKNLIEIINGSHHIGISNCNFYGTQSFPDTNGEYDGTHAIYISSDKGGGDISITNNEFMSLLGSDPDTPSNAKAINVSGRGNTEETKLSNIVIANNKLDNIAPANSEAITIAGNVDGFLVENNTISNVNNIGIDLAGNYSWHSPNPELNQARNGVVKNNTVAKANSISGDGFAAGIYVDGGKNITVENNKVTQCDVGFSINAEQPGIVSGIVLRNNLAFLNQKAGIRFGANGDENKVVSDCQILNNTSFNNDILGKGFGQLWVEVAKNCTVENNIFYSSIDARLLNSWEENKDNQNSLDYNLWFYDAVVPHPDNPFVWSSTSYSDFSSYQAGTEFGKNSIYLEDPKEKIFVDITKLDLRLADTSVAIDAGDPSFTPGNGEVDANARNRVENNRVDMGAYEYSHSANNPAIQSNDANRDKRKFQRRRRRRRVPPSTL